MGIKKTKENEKTKIVITERVHQLLAEFSELVSDNLPDSLPLKRDI